MYEFLASAEPHDVLRGHHVGSAADYLAAHRANVKRHVRGDRMIPAVRRMASSLLDRIGDARTLRLAWAHLAHTGGSAPGLDGRRYHDYGDAEVWSLCRAVGAAIRSGTYRIGPECRRDIPKASGRGTRPLCVMSIVDRVVSRAAASILEPVLAPLFCAGSYGARAGTGPWHALAHAEAIACTSERYVWVSADLRDAYCRVPLSRLAQVLAWYLPDDRLQQFLTRDLASDVVPGLRQGSPLSPLLLALYLHHVFDYPWSLDRKLPPVIRYVDDLLLLCTTRDEAAVAHAALIERLTPAGLVLKPGDGPAHDLTAGERIDWLGLTLHRDGPGVGYDFSIRSWTRLESLFAAAHQHADPAHRAFHGVVRSWLRYRAPCYASSRASCDIRRIKETAARYGFEELPPRGVIQRMWAAHAGKWQAVRTSTRRRVPTSTRADP